MTIKAILIAAAAVVAFGLFAIRLQRLIGLMRAAEGTAAFKLEPISERIKILFCDVLGQANVRRKPLIGLAHMLIFFGFIAVQPHSLQLMIGGIVPSFEAARWVPGLYGPYLFIADILAFLVIFGLAYALYRRLVVKPDYLTDGRDARLILLFTFVIIVTFHWINAFQIVLSAQADGFDYERYFTVSHALTDVFSLDTLSPLQARTGFEIAYWVHMLTILGFLVYIPGSKHLHLLAAIPNVFLKPLDREKAIIKNDLEDESVENFGLGSVAELNWKNVLDLYACTECGRCEEQCPADITAKPLSPKRIIVDTKHDLFDQGGKILAREMELVKPIIREGSPVTPDVLWSCTSCRACEDICPVDIQHLDLIFEMRKYQVLMEANFPAEMQNTFTSLENQANPWGFNNDDRAGWREDLDVPLMSDNPDADVLYFVGCAGSFDDRGKQIARAVARVLQKAAVDFAILGPEEACNGDVARRAGNEYLAQMLIQQNVEVLNRYRPKKILTGCPHCFNILKNEYPQFGAAYPVIHHTELFLELHKQGRLHFSDKGREALTYHDSCYLGRWNNLYSAPRDLLAALIQPQQLIEMQRTRSKGFCCGAGGARMFMEENLGKHINIERAEEIIACGAQTVAAVCPFCATMLRDGILEKESGVQVKDIAELIDEATI